MSHAGQNVLPRKWPQPKGHDQRVWCRRHQEADIWRERRTPPRAERVNNSRVEVTQNTDCRGRSNPPEQGSQVIPPPSSRGVTSRGACTTTTTTCKKWHDTQSRSHHTGHLQVLATSKVAPGPPTGQALLWECQLLQYPCMIDP